MICKYEYSLYFLFSEKFKFVLSMRNRLTFVEKRNKRSIIPKLLLDFYKENYPFRAEFSANAYVFVFSIIT